MFVCWHVVAKKFLKKTPPRNNVSYVNSSSGAGTLGAGGASAEWLRLTGLISPQQHSSGRFIALELNQRIANLVGLHKRMP